MEASYAYPSAQSWLQSQGTCQLCGSNGYLLSGRELKSQIDVIQKKLKDVADLSRNAEAAKAEFSKSFSPSEIDSQQLILEDLKKRLFALRTKKVNGKVLQVRICGFLVRFCVDELLLKQMEEENHSGTKFLHQSKINLNGKVQLIAQKKLIANDLRQRLKELSNVRTYFSGSFYCISIRSCLWNE